jgi:HEAT repeat protein
MRYHDWNRKLAGIIFILLTCLTPRFAMGQRTRLAGELVEQFNSNRIFWQQFEVAKKLVELHDNTVLGPLKTYLNDDDRLVRGNAAFVFAALGDDRGFEVIRAILNDRSDRPRGQTAGENWSLGEQIRNDRYYAAHLFGDLKDARALPIFVPLLNDQQVNWIVPWALGEIGDKAAIRPLIQTLSDKSPDMRGLAIYALETLKAKEALPQLHLLFDDEETIHFDGLGTVGEAARTAVAKLNALP